MATRHPSRYPGVNNARPRESAEEVADGRTGWNRTGGSSRFTRKGRHSSRRRGRR